MKGAQGLNYDTELESVKDLYKEDFDMQSLKAQFLILQSQLKKDKRQLSFADIISFLQSVGSNLTLLSEVVKLVILLFVAPAINVTSECSFSALR